MKLLLENWRRYITEEQKEVEEGLGTKLAMGAALAGAAGIGSPAYADATDTSADSETTQQVQSEVEVNTLEKNDDGTYSITVDLGSLTSLSKSMASMLQASGGSMARTALLKALTGKSQGSVSAEISWKDISGNPTSPFSGAAQYVTATGTATAG
mgnify:FL=1|jgi:hypothetical protein|tara:strand:- start:338 stop:802 length:465 start_codon:yes stop_codon:yes gene_type:complete